jgi:MtN3 and saliva related transmembrane protein
VLTADLIGWSSSGVLLVTLARQVYTQWRERSTQGVSRWLFIGQLAASIGFLVYSVLVRNWVFVFTNAALLVTAIVGQVIYKRNVREQSEAAPACVSDR